MLFLFKIHDPPVSYINISASLITASWNDLYKSLSRFYQNLPEDSYSFHSRSPQNLTKIPVTTCKILSRSL